MRSEKVLFEKRNVQNYRNKKRKNQSTSHALLAYHVVIFDTPVLWKIHKNGLQRSIYIRLMKIHYLFNSGEN